MTRLEKWGLIIGGPVAVCCFLWGVSLELSKKLDQEQRQQNAAADPVFEHGFRVGYGMAKTGMIKPSGNELDAMARQAAMQIGDRGGLGFKMQWKNAFWAGWSKGD